MKVLKLGSTGKEVEDLQKYLKIKVDGDFWVPKTEEAVKKFQKENKLTPDGIVGQKTWNAMGFVSTDLSETVITTEKLIIDQKYMDKDEYLLGPTKKNICFYTTQQEDMTHMLLVRCGIMTQEVE